MKHPLEVHDKSFLADEWGIEGYKPPKTCLFGSRDYTMAKSKRKNFTEVFIELNKSSEPAKYSDTIEASSAKYWLNNSGHFAKEKRETFTAYSMKKSRLIPGPGHYFKQNPQESKIISIKNGVFNKAERGHFLQDLEAGSQQVPCSWKYTPYSDPKNKFSNPIYHKPYYNPQVLKSSIGPGTYYEAIENGLNKTVLKSTVVFTIPKAKKKNYLAKKIEESKSVPGVGHYPRSSSYNTIYYNALKQKSIGHSYTLKRFTETVAMDKNWVPGPGTYELGPKRKVYK